MKVKLLKKLRKEAKRKCWVKRLNRKLYIVMKDSRERASFSTFEEAKHRCDVVRCSYISYMIYKLEEKKYNKRIY